MNVEIDSIANNSQISKIAAFTTSSSVSKDLHTSWRTYSEILSMIRWSCVDEVLGMIALVVLGRKNCDDGLPYGNWVA